MRQFEPSTDEPPPLYKVRMPLHSYDAGVTGVEITGHVKPDGGAELRARYCAYSVVTFSEEAIGASTNLSAMFADAVPRLVRGLLDYAASDVAAKLKATL